MQALDLLFVTANGNNPTNGGGYPSLMPKNGKPARPKPAAERPEKRHAPVVHAAAKAALKIWEWAERDSRWKDRDNPKKLAAVMSKHPAKWGGFVASKNKLYGIRNGAQAVGIDGIEAFARAFGFEAWQLLTPDFDPENPPVIVTRSERDAMDGLVQARADAKSILSKTDETTRRYMSEEASGENVPGGTVDADSNPQGAGRGPGDATPTLPAAAATKPARKKGVSKR